MGGPRGTSERRNTLPPIIPRLRHAQRDPGHLSLDGGVLIRVAESARSASTATVQRLQAGLEAHRISRPQVVSGRSSRSQGCAVELTIDPEVGELRHLDSYHDVYRLHITPDGAALSSPSAAGLHYAAETLLQLIGPDGRLPCCTIEDGADLELRGLMLDISRGKVPTRESLEDLIDTCAALKLNLLMLYTEHTFRFKKHPLIGRGDSPLSARTLSALDAYAADRFVDLVPCLQSLGHMEHILKLPRYRAMAETDQGWTIAPTHPQTLPLLRDLYHDYLPLFRSKWFNANCDEPWDLGRGQSKKRSETLGPGGLYLEHVKRIQRLAARHGKRTMIWGDVVHAHPHRIPELDPNLVLLDWWYEADFDFDRVKVFARNEIDFMVCPGTSSWNSLFPRVANSLANISGWAEAGRRHGALGLVNTDWGDHGHYNLQGNSLLAYAWAGQEAWSGTSPSREFDRAFSRLFFADASGEVARIYRALGALHDPGFKVFNGSALQYLFFDSVDTAYFIAPCQVSRLEALGRRLKILRTRIDKARRNARRGQLEIDEILYAADASDFSIRKALAGKKYLAWRRDPSTLRAPGRRALAQKMNTLATEQIGLGKRLRKLWLARAQTSNLDMTLGRLRRSARHLRAAARRLEKNLITASPDKKAITLQGVLESVRESLR